MSLRKKRSSKGGVSTGTSSGDSQNVLKTLNDPEVRRKLPKLWTGMSIKPKDGKIWVNGEEMEYFDTGNVVKVVNPPRLDFLGQWINAAHYATKSSSHGEANSGATPVKGTGNDVCPGCGSTRRDSVGYVASKEFGRLPCRDLWHSYKLPTSEDLDAVAEEERIKWLTAKK